ncbi:MAG: hypothetical protein IJ956_00990 [Akkermansia sp.]|nr:hypothetical protein [Akkermansia sp.]
MNIEPLLPSDLFAAVVYAGFLLTICVFVPVKITAKIRRIRRARTHLTCRICGFRFLRRDAEGTCPHCHSRNG